MTANEFIGWLERHKAGTVPGSDGLQGVYVIWDGSIQALIENCGEYWEKKKK